MADFGGYVINSPLPAMHCVSLSHSLAVIDWSLAGAHYEITVAVRLPNHSLRSAL